jgi:TrmH family RNA methyltransferase
MMARMDSALANRLRYVSSRQNTLVKELRRAFAQGECTSDGHCAIESVRIVEEAIRSGLRFRAVFFSDSVAESRAGRVLPQLSPQVETLVLPDDVFQGAVATESPQGIAALVRLREHTLDEVLAPPQPLLVVAAGIQDPGNLGTIVRSAEAFGATGLLIAERTVGPFNPKVVRASAGSLFRLPVVRAGLAAVLPRLRQTGLRLIATSSHKGVPLDQASEQLAGPLALFIGGEGAGLPRDVLAAIDSTVVIPHSPRVESLNAGIAAAIVLYEISCQRKGMRT